MKTVKVAAFLAYKNIVFSIKSFFLISSIIGLTYLSGIFIGGVINGLQILIEDKAIATITGNVVILPESDQEVIENVKVIEKKLKSLPGVVEVSPRYVIPAVAVDSKGNKAGINLVIVDPQKEMNFGMVDDYVVEGRFVSKGTKNGLVIGGALTEKYKLFEGIEKVDVSAGDYVSLKIAGMERRTKILGIYSLKFTGAEIYAYMNVRQAEEIGIDTNNLDKATEILIKTSKKGNEEEIVRKIKLLGIKGEVRTWKDQLGLISQFTDSLMITNKIALFVSIIVTFGTIYIMIYINAFQKRSQLGILKAIGISQNTLVLSYIMQSIAYVVSGIVIGLILAYLSVKFFTQYPIEMPFGSVVPVFQKESIIDGIIPLIVASVTAGYFASKNIIKKRILEMIFSG